MTRNDPWTRIRAGLPLALTDRGARRMPGSGNAGRRAIADASAVPVRCVIVDDSALFLESAADLLRREGLDVVGIASNTGEAIRLVSRVRPDVILVDIYLCDEDGFELAQRLHEISGPSSNIILVS